MRSKVSVVGCVALALACAAVPLEAQRGARGAGGQGAPTGGFPAQRRPVDPELAARGNSLYGIHCRSCHGADLRGGEQGGPNLLRSALMLNDQAGELLQPIVRDGRLLFSGDGSGNFVALDARNGKPLWHTRIGNASNAPQTYLVDGRQHVLVAIGDTLYAFVLY